MKVLEVSPNLANYYQPAIEIGAKYDFVYWAPPSDFKLYLASRGIEEINQDLKNKNIALLIFDNDNILCQIVNDANLDWLEKYMALI